MPDQAEAAPADPQLVLLAADEKTGTIGCGVALGTDWERLLCDMVLDAGRRAQQGHGA